MSEKSKTIRISEKNYERLSKFGDFHDTFDSVIEKLLTDQRGEGEDA